VTTGFMHESDDEKEAIISYVTSIYSTNLPSNQHRPRIVIYTYGNNTEMGINAVFYDRL
jgi:hypothetical protein